MGQRFIGLTKRWEINNEPPPKIEPLYVHVPVALLSRDPNAYPLVPLLYHANGDKSVSPTQRTNISMGDQMRTSQFLRQRNVGGYNAGYRSGEVASVPPGLQTSQSRSRSPSVELHWSTIRRKTNRLVVLRRSKIPHGRSDPGGTSATKTRPHAWLLPLTSLNYRGLPHPRQAPRASGVALHERRAWLICHP